MTSAPSSSPSPMTGTPEREPMTGLPSSMSKITSWLPNTINGNPYPPESSEWATPSTPPRSASPPAINRRHSVPPGQRKSSESKLRSVLSVIDEARPRQEMETSSLPESTQPPTVTTRSLQRDTSQDSGWDFTYGRSPYENGQDGDTTPRHSSLFSSHSPPPDSDPGLVLECRDSDDLVHSS